MKTTSLLVALAIATGFPKTAYSYTIVHPGSTNPISNWSPYGGNHWDSYSWYWSPTSGESLGSLAGNIQGMSTPLEILPNQGDPAAGSVRVQIQLLATEVTSLHFNNYDYIPYDFHDRFHLIVRSGFSGPTIASYDVPLGDNYLSFDLNVGEVYSFIYAVNSVAHETHENESWHPTVADPSLPGEAFVLMSGTLKPLSIEIVPEPSVAALSAGLWLIAARFSKKRQSKNAK